MTQTTETLWRELSDQLRHFLQSQVSDPSLAEDLLQECFLRIHRNLTKLQDDQRLVSWVYQIARNLVSDHFRKQYRRQDAAHLDTPSDHPKERNLNAELGQTLKSFLPLLPNHSREVLELYEFQGLSQPAIADRLNLSLSATKSRLQRGRQQLRKLLLDCCELESDRYGNIVDCREKDPQSCTHCDPDAQ